MATLSFILWIMPFCFDGIKGQYMSAKALDCHEGFKVIGVNLIEREFKSPSLINCNLRCLRNDKCVATNFQIMAGSGAGNCELLLPHELTATGHEVVLSKKDDTVYTRIKVINN